jgi:hypothetical protein
MDILLGDLEVVADTLESDQTVDYLLHDIGRNWTSFSLTVAVEF